MTHGCHMSADRVLVDFGGGVPTLDSLSLDCPAGEFLAVIGPSGCGKSTLLRCFAGLQAVHGGTIQRATSSGRAPRVAFVFQDPTLLPWRNVWENIGLPLELSGSGTRERREAAMEALQLIGLPASDAFKFPAMLSGGMRMRVSLARALVTRPDVLMLDEPFAALDDISRQQLNDELLRLWQEQRWTALFVTHNVSEAVYLSQRILVMAARPGRIVSDVRVQSPESRDASWRGTASFASQAGDVAQRLREAAA
jgi:NitT/TauT family transport system ATP-binding protein